MLRLKLWHRQSQEDREAVASPFHLGGFLASGDVEHLCFLFR